MNEKKNKILYKYRSLNNFKNFVDIILNKRLYASKYKDLNDPMEGIYYYQQGELNNNIRTEILNEKSNLRICSLSSNRNNVLMWSYYANGHKGVAIGVEIKNYDEYEIRQIQYSGPTQFRDLNLHNQPANDILSYKHEIWSHENEVRVFVKNNKYIEVNIKEVITGVDINEDDYKLIEELVKKIDKKIKIIKMANFNKSQLL